jgi:hypothetical protein
LIGHTPEASHVGFGAKWVVDTRVALSGELEASVKEQ